MEYCSNGPFTAKLEVRRYEGEIVSCDNSTGSKLIDKIPR